MTREEASNILDDYDVNFEGHTAEEIAEAFDVAFRALEQEPVFDRDCEHCSKTYGTLGCCTTVSNKWVYSCKEGHEEYARGIRRLGSTTKNNLGVGKDILALLEKTYTDFCECEGGEAWLKIDGKEYSTDAAYAIEGVRIFMEVFKQRLKESEEV